MLGLENGDLERMGSYVVLCFKMRTTEVSGEQRALDDLSTRVAAEERSEQVTRVTSVSAV